MRTIYDSDDNQVNLIEDKDISSGNNQSNNYVKLPDGTLICYGWEKHNNVTVNKSWGNLYYVYLEPNMKSYPIPFVNSPSVTFTSGSTNILSVTHATYHGNRLPSIMVVSATSQTINELYVYYIAIGKWK